MSTATGALHHADEHHDWKPAANPWLVAASVMLATFMVVLDSSVANVSLPHIAGNLSSTTDEIAGQNPGRLIGGRREVARNVRQGDVGH